MDREELVKKLHVKNNTKLILLVFDGIGGLPMKDGKTELESAVKPNLDQLTKDSTCGMVYPVMPGITPGSGPGHLGLFGYDPLKYNIGRGILEALGEDIEIGDKDIAIRGNFATVKDGIVVDRRAGRPKTEISSEIVRRLSSKIKEIDGVKISIYPGREHRFVLVLTGDNLDDRLTDADPQKTGEPVTYAKPLVKEAEFTANVINKFMDKLMEELKDEEKINSCLLRGYSKYPKIPSMEELYGVKAACIATYPMYKGISKLVGMDVLKFDGETIEDEFKALEKYYDDYDYFYVHIKKTDSYGEDGNFDAKVHIIEETDKYINKMMVLDPDVVVVTGDHSTPALLKGHSWHPNPFLIYSKYQRKDDVESFTEKECAVKGIHGHLHSKDLIFLMLANSLRLEKFGA